MDYLDRFFEGVWFFITEVFLFLINLIPAPDFTDDVISTIDQVVDYASYPAYLTAIDAGLPMVASAYLIRFTIRRLPFVG